MEVKGRIISKIGQIQDESEGDNSDFDLFLYFTTGHPSPSQANSSTRNLDFPLSCAS